VIASCAAPWQVDANRWIWIMEAQSNNYGWLNPHVLQSALNAEHLVVEKQLSILINCPVSKRVTFYNVYIFGIHFLKI